MNAQEAGRILAILAAVDNREVDATKAQGWAWALPDVPYERGLEAAKRAVRAEGYVDPAAVLREMKAMQPSFERDVRSAKARGLVSADWPARTPLPMEVERRLRALQADAYSSTNDTELDTTTGPITRQGLER